MKAGTDKKKTVGATGKTNAPAVGEFIMNKKQTKIIDGREFEVYFTAEIGGRKYLHWDGYEWTLNRQPGAAAQFDTRDEAKAAVSQYSKMSDINPKLFDVCSNISRAPVA